MKSVWMPLEDTQAPRPPGYPGLGTRVTENPDREDESMAGDEWAEALLPVAGEWRGYRYDSRLELAWLVTLTYYGVRFEFHPGSLTVSDDGTRWEPDLLLTDGDVLVEVKPHAGESAARLWKAEAAARRYGKSVLVFRPGRVAPDPTCETAGAEWESATGERWVFEVATRRWVPEEVSKGRVLFSADEVLLDPLKEGLEMLHWSRGGTL